MTTCQICSGPLSWLRRTTTELLAFSDYLMTAVDDLISEDDAVEMDGRLTFIERIPANRRDRLVDLCASLPYKEHCSHEVFWS